MATQAPIDMLLLLLSLITQATLPQLPHARPAFTSSSELVVLRVSVVDRRAGFVEPGCRARIRQCFEDNRPQPIAFFAERRHTGHGRPGHRQQRQHAAPARRRDRRRHGIRGSSHPADELFTLNFNEHVWPGLPPGHPFTSDRHELRTALESIDGRAARPRSSTPSTPGCGTSSGAPSGARCWSSSATEATTPARRRSTGCARRRCGGTS